MTSTRTSRRPATGAAYLAAKRARTGTVAAADAVLASVADLVAFASDYLAGALPRSATLGHQP